MTIVADVFIVSLMLKSCGGKHHLCCYNNLILDVTGKQSLDVGIECSLWFDMKVNKSGNEHK